MYQSFDRRSKTRDTSKYSDNDDDSDDPEGLLIMTYHLTCNLIVLSISTCSLPNIMHDSYLFCMNLA